MATASRPGRQTPALAIIVNRPEHEPGFRLDRQENTDRTMKYTLHSYATEDPVGYRYGATVYDIVMRQGAGAAGAVLVAENGVKQGDNCVRLVDDHGEHRVTVDGGGNG